MRISSIIDGQEKELFLQLVLQASSLWYIFFLSMLYILFSKTKHAENFIQIKKNLIFSLQKLFDIGISKN